MIKHYLNAVVNQLLKNKLFSFINIAGLSIGLTACILIALYVLDETSYDKHWANADRIYRVNTSSNISGQGFRQAAATAMPVLPALQQYFPQEIETGSRFMPLASEIAIGESHFEEVVTRVDSGFLGMFEIETVAGNLQSSLSDPSNVALRQDVAERMFGARETIGQVLNISYNGVTRDYRVGAIYRFPSGNSVLDLPVLTLLDETVLPPVYQNWGALTIYSYLQLTPGVASDQVMSRLRQFTDDVVDISSLQAGAEVSPGERMRFDLQAITDIHLNSSFDAARAGGNRTVIIAFTAIAVLVLLIGIINFTVLSTAKASQRAKEVAMRKAIGARRMELVLQFLCESFMVVLPAMLMAFMLVELMLPVFEVMVGKSLQVSWLSVDTMLAMLGLYLGVGILGGLYPAFILSRFRPAETLKGNLTVENQSSLGMRNLLVIFQFGISITLMVATAVIYAQVQYAQGRDPGFNRNNILVIDSLIERAGVNAEKETLKSQVLQLNNVANASLSSHQPTQRLGMANVSAPYTLLGSGGGPELITTLGIDYRFFETYEIDIIAGRNFSENLDQAAEIFPQQAQGLAPSKVIINASAARTFGFGNPIEAIGNQLQFTNPVTRISHDLTIIGIAADTSFYSLNAVPRAEIYSLSPGFTDVLSVRYTGDPQTLLSGINSIWQSIMGDVPLSMSFVEQNMMAEFAQEQVEAQILVSFSLLAITIACLGLYGSAAFTVERRTKEIGIRKVMGAEVREIVSLLMWQFSKPVLVANVIAWPVALWAMLNWLQRFPYQLDALLLIPLCMLAGFTALSIAWLTVAGNTMKVARRKPVYALRYE